MIDFLKFDQDRPNASFYDIIIYTAAIFVSSNLIFMILISLFGINANDSIENEKNKEYDEWYKKNISVWSLILSNMTNSSIYSPIAEEIVFRLVLLKYILVDKFKLNIYTSIIIQSLIFGSLHLSNITFTTQTKKYTYLQTFSAIITGIISGWVFYHTNSLLPCIFSHIINNTSASISEIIGYIKYKREKSKIQ